MSKINAKYFDCAAATEHLHEYLDGELQRDLRTAMERHLASCASCAATLAQLRQIENAHQQLDARLETPSEKYWQALPQRVMEKVKASEKRRLLTLPKLPLLKSSSRTPAAEKSPQHDLLYLSPFARKFLSGPAKYILPLAAVAAFCFFLIRELRERPEPSIMTASSPQQPLAEARSAPEAVVEKSSTPPATVSNKQSTPAATAVQPIAHENLALLPDTTLATIGRAVGAGGQGAGLIATAESSRFSRIDVASKTGKTEGVISLSAPSLALESQPRAVDDNARQTAVSVPALPAQILTESSSQVKDQPAAQLAKEAMLSQDEAESQATDAPLVKSDESHAKKLLAPGRMGVSSSTMRSASNLADTQYAKTLQRAQETSDLKKREKIWRDFLKTNPESSSRAMAIANLARTIAAASDSATKPEQLEKNIAFFRDNAAILHSQIGATEFDRGLARLQALLEARQKASNEKP
jgi:anti-sigma factor RsiW